jgi:ribose transport system substrate-binding protein
MLKRIQCALLTTGATLVAGVFMFVDMGAGNAAAAAMVPDATAASDALEATVKFTPPGPSFKAGDALSGKTIYAIVSGESAAFVQEFIKGMRDGAAVLGANVEVQDSGYDPTKASELIDKGVALGAAVIVTQSVDSSAVAASLKGAKTANIPVIEATSRDAGAAGADLEALGVKAISSFCYTCAGKQMADFAVSSTNGNVNALLYNVPGIVVSERMVKGFTDELAHLCPSCSVKLVDAPAANWETNLASLTTSNLQTNPNINILVPVFDAMVGMIEPAIASSGLKGVSIVTYNATAPALGMLAAGKLVTGDVGGSPYWLGWATVDQAVRLATGNKPVADVAVPHRLFDAKNVKQINLAKPQQSWYGSFDLAAQYKALWGK